MFGPDKTLPPPPTAARPRNESLGSTLPTYRNRPTGLNMSQNDNFSFASVRNMFENAKRGVEVTNTLMKNPIVQKMAYNQQVRNIAVSTAKNPNVQKEAFNAFNSSASTKKSENLYPELSALDPFNFPPQLPNQQNYFSQPDRRHEERLMWNKSAAPAVSSSSTCDDLLSIFSSKKSAPARPPPPKFNGTSRSNPNLFAASKELSDIFQPISYANHLSNSPPIDPYNTSQPKAIVKYPYKAANYDEISIAANDLLLLKKEVDGDWIYVTNTRTSESGIVPLRFLQIQIPLEFSAIYTERNRKGICQARALYDYDTGVDGDLQFKCGDQINICSRVNSEWLRGEFSGRSGIFPLNFVQIELGNYDELYMESNAEKKNFVTALYDYSSGVIEDLEFKAGDVIEVITQTNSSDWIMGKLGYKNGLVPLTYVRKN